VTTAAPSTALSSGPWVMIVKPSSIGAIPVRWICSPTSQLMNDDFPEEGLPRNRTMGSPDVSDGGGEGSNSKRLPIGSSSVS
jgi:hypothetical protein